jgi:hypothetical protein
MIEINQKLEVFQKKISEKNHLQLTLVFQTGKNDTLFCFSNFLFDHSYL